MINASHVNAIRRLVIDVTQVLKSEYVKFSASCTAVQEPRSFFLFFQELHRLVIISFILMTLACDSGLMM